MILVFLVLIASVGAITDSKSNCSFSFSSLLVDGTVSFDTVHRVTFANCFFNWEDWFGCTSDCDLMAPLLSAFMPANTSEMFQVCNGISVPDFDNCVSGFVMRYGALYVPDDTHVKYVPEKNECFGQLKFMNNVIWFITSHLTNEICCSNRIAANPFIPVIENNNFN
ncbi:ORF6 [Coronavirus AcCoV-JC34]|uniref:ORF6 n=1 Tax=Coronavirus AcCoV-JC34 TaxID=1964806 RepID=UPI000B425CCD|nr:ORF6 [Coronavirus AcCoV-JC34]AQW43027.1 ORF6 [Coronavirus AcCoV-JC34]